MSDNMERYYKNREELMKSQKKLLAYYNYLEYLNNQIKLYTSPEYQHLAEFENEYDAEVNRIVDDMIAKENGASNSTTGLDSAIAVGIEDLLIANADDDEEDVDFDFLSDDLPTNDRAPETDEDLRELIASENPPVSSAPPMAPYESRLKPIVPPKDQELTPSKFQFEEMFANTDDLPSINRWDYLCPITAKGRQRRRPNINRNVPINVIENVLVNVIGNDVVNVTENVPVNVTENVCENAAQSLPEAQVEEANRTEVVGVAAQADADQPNPDGNTNMRLHTPIYIPMKSDMEKNVEKLFTEIERYPLRNKRVFKRNVLESRLEDPDFMEETLKFLESKKIIKIVNGKFDFRLIGPRPTDFDLI